MSTWLLEGEISILLALLAAPLLLPLLLHFIYRRYGRFAGMPAFWAVVAAFYLLGVLAFTVFPLPESQTISCAAGTWMDTWQLRPGGNILPAFESVSQAGIHGIVGGSFLQIFFNIILFVPLGFLIAYLLRKPWWVAVGAGLFGSLLIEVTQGTAILGLYPCPYRNADVDDLILNTTGAGVGWLIGYTINRRYPYSDPAPVPDIARPTLRRRATAFVVDIVVWIVIAIIFTVLTALILEGLGMSRNDVAGIGRWILPIIGISLFLLVPWIRPSRATLGQTTVRIQPVASSHGDRPTSRSTLITFVTRWLLIVAWSYGFLVVGVIELVSALMRKDRRSLSSVLAGTSTTTTNAVRSEQESASPSHSTEHLTQND